MRDYSRVTEANVPDRETWQALCEKHNRSELHEMLKKSVCDAAISRYQIIPWRRCVIGGHMTPPAEMVSQKSCKACQNLRSSNSTQWCKPSGPIVLADTACIWATRVIAAPVEWIREL